MLLDPLLDPLKSVLVFNRRKIYIDNLIFRMHYTWTVFVLVASALLIGAKLYIGKPIYCMGSDDVKEIANEYCFIHSTFTKGKFEKGKWTYEPVRDNEIAPGVRPSVKGDKIIPHAYYQWVWCILLLQAIAFYFPYWCWEKIEAGRIMMLVGNLNLPMTPDESKAKQRQKILWYFDTNRGFHNKYAFYHAMLEILNMVHVCAEVFMTDYILNYEFSTFGLNLFSLTLTMPYLRDDSLSRVFPTVTACRIQTGGVAFGKNQHDLLCVLPINIVHEKIYICLWFWFIIVAIFSLSGLVYRLLTLFCPKFRKWLVVRRARFITDDVVNVVSHDSQYGDWFLIYKLSQNMDEVAFGDLIRDISDTFANGGTPRFLRRKSHRPSIVIDFASDETPMTFEKLIHKMI